MDTNQKNELADIVVRGCGRVWDSIGYDCLQVCEGDSMPADHVVDCHDPLTGDGRFHGVDRFTSRDRYTRFFEVLLPLVF